MASDYERFKARMAAWEARAKVVERGPDDAPARRRAQRPKRPPRPKHDLERKSLWAARSRCTNPRDKAYENYGARGIRVCREWCGKHGFDRFFAHIGPRPDKSYTLDRINNDGDYEPGNVRWATHVEQANNRRSSRWITWRGETHTVAEWARRFGCRPNEITRRAEAGCPLDRFRRKQESA